MRVLCRALAGVTSVALAGALLVLGPAPAALASSGGYTVRDTGGMKVDARVGQPWPSITTGAANVRTVVPQYSSTAWGAAIRHQGQGICRHADGQITYGGGYTSGGFSWGTSFDWSTSCPVGVSVVGVRLVTSEAYQFPDGATRPAGTVISEYHFAGYYVPPKPQRPAGAHCRLTVDELVGLARAAGFTGNDVPIAAAVAMAESGGWVDAVGALNSNNTYDLGLWQINQVHQPDEARALSDPLYNATLARNVFTGAPGTWSAWAAYNNGSYVKHLTAAQGAASRVTGPLPLTSCSGSLAGPSSGDGTGSEVADGGCSRGWDLPAALMCLFRAAFVPTQAGRDSIAQLQTVKDMPPFSWVGSLAAAVASGFNAGSTTGIELPWTTGKPGGDRTVVMPLGGGCARGAGAPDCEVTGFGPAADAAYGPIRLALIVGAWVTVAFAMVRRTSHAFGAKPDSGEDDQ